MNNRFSLTKLRIIEKEYEGILLERGGPNSSMEVVHVYRQTEKGTISVGQIKSNEGALSDYELRTQLVALLRQC
ncbi:hypothetical protein C0416_04485 [bacterium]|nr:hypothetical protein [bacterium]